MTARAQHLTEGPRGAAAGPPVDDTYDGLGPIDDVWWLPLGADEASVDLDARRDDFGWDDELHGLLDGDAWAFADSDETVTAVRDLIDWLATLVPDEPVGEAGVVGAAGLEGSPADLIDLIGGLERLKGAIAATQARATAAFAREVVRDAFARRASARKARSAIAPQIALARRCSPATADRYLALARALPGMPHTQAALTEGVIDERAAGAIVRETSVLTPELRARVDELIAPRLATSSLKQLAGAAARHAAELDPAAVVAKHERALSERGAWTRPAPDGMAYLSIFGPLTGIVGAYASLLRHATAVVAGHCETDSEESLADPLDGRTQAQVMSDTAIRWLSGVTPGQAVPVALNLVMPAEALFAADDATTAQPSVRPPRSRETPARIPGHGILPAALARRLLLHGCEAPDTAKYKPPERDSSPPGSPPGGTRLAEPAQVFLTRVFASPDGRDLLALDATARLFPPKLRAALIVRDDRCRTPYCDASIRHADHIQSANSGGPTSLSNGQGLCVRCNYTKELEGFSTRVLDEHHVPGAGPNTHVTEVTTPTGHRYVSVAPPLLE